MLRHLLPVLIAATVLFGSSAVASEQRFQNEPDGFGKARFGLSPAEVAKLYPSAKPLDKEFLGATPVFSPFIARQHLTEQKVPGLSKPVSVELRYWKDKLWVVIVYFGDNSAEQVEASLRERFGEPMGTGTGPYWTGEKVSITTAVREKWYSISDNAASAEVRHLFAEEMRKMHRARAPQPKRAQSSAPAAPAEGAEDGESGRK